MAWYWWVLIAVVVLWLLGVLSFSFNLGSTGSGTP